MADALRSALYIRVSTLEQAKEGYSIQAQETKLTNYANGMGYKIVNKYIDDGFSGKSIEGRPAMQKLLNDIKLSKIDIVIMYKLDRLSRKVKDTLELVELFEKYNVTLFSLNENIDLSSPFGRAALKMSATFSELERETIVERFMMGKEQRVNNGLAMRNSTLPIGYDYDEKTKRFIVNEKEAEQIKKIFELYLKGWNMAQISRYMHQNYTNRYMSYNDRTAVGKVLRNPFSAGYFIYNGTVHKATNIDPIIDYKTWVQAEIMRLNTKKKLLMPTSPYLLTGLLYCGKCGGKYYAKKYKETRQLKKCDKTYLRYRYGCEARVKFDPQYHQKRCDNDIILQSELDKIVIDNVKNLEFSEFKSPDNQLEQASILEIEITDLKHNIDKFLDLFESNIIDKAQLEARVNKNNKLIEQKQRLLEEQKENIEFKPDLEIEKIKEKIKNFDNLSMVDKRVLLMSLIKKITICPNQKLDIEWKVK